jgi:hypothetical protein
MVPMIGLSKLPMPLITTLKMMKAVRPLTLNEAGGAIRSFCRVMIARNLRRVIAGGKIEPARIDDIEAGFFDRWRHDLSENAAVIVIGPRHEPKPSG